MRISRHFKNPEEPSDCDELDDLVEDDEDYVGGAVLVEPFSEEEISDVEVGAAGNAEYSREAVDDDDSDDSSDFDPQDENVDGECLLVEPFSESSSSGTEEEEEAADDDDSDDSEFNSDTDSDESMTEVQRKFDGKRMTKVSNSEASTSKDARKLDEANECGTSGNGVLDLNEEDEDDETVRAIIAAIKKPRTTPPEIKSEDFITDICFHPGRDIIAVATITGDVCIYEYSNEANILLRTIEAHAKACRDVEFTEDGVNLLTCSKDKSIMVTDVETEKLKKFYESAHEEAINKLHVIDEHLFATGDDAGTVKLWDLRTKNEIFALKEVEDYVTQLLTNDAAKLLLVTSGDGYLTTINIGARKLYVQSEPYEEELTCMGTYRGDSKLVVGTSKGNLYSFNWGQFGYHCDKFPGIKTPIGEMLPITDRIGCVAGEEGVIRAFHIAPFRNLGIVGQHNMPIEALDINNSGELIASSSHNNDVRFWNIKYFEDFVDIKYNAKHNNYKEKRHNLPSSKFSNTSDFFSDLAKPPSDVD